MGPKISSESLVSISAGDCLGLAFSSGKSFFGERSLTCNFGVSVRLSCLLSESLDRCRLGGGISPGDNRLDRCLFGGGISPGDNERLCLCR